MVIFFLFLTSEHLIIRYHGYVTDKHRNIEVSWKIYQIYSSVGEELKRNIEQGKPPRRLLMRYEKKMWNN